jgi:hypothetical protein
MNITLTGGELLGWFKFDEVYGFSQNIDSAVYAFGVFEKVPSSEQLPINLKSVLYIGQTGGQEKVFDKKNRDSDRCYLRSSFHARMKDHVTKGKVKLIRENMGVSDTLCVCIIVPKKYMDETSIKNWLLASESELINCYSSIFKQPPMYNYAHHSNRTQINENSVSQKKILEMKQRSIGNFCV